MRNITLVENLPFTVPPIEDLTDVLPRHKTKVYPMREAEQIDTITVHHFASDAPLINQAAFHVNGHGWPGIGYSMVVWKDKLYQTNDLLSQAYHSKDHNHHSIGIAVLGNLSKRPLTDVERNLLYAGILTSKHHLPSIQRIEGHNEQGKTACPCTDMNRIRSDIAALEQSMRPVEEPVVELPDLREEKIRKALALINEINWLVSERNAGKDYALDQLAEQYDFMKSMSRI
jgi:N-acetylmuramoyl-L-alanine amidase